MMEQNKRPSNKNGRRPLAGGRKAAASGSHPSKRKGMHASAHPQHHRPQSKSRVASPTDTLPPSPTQGGVVESPGAGGGGGSVCTFTLSYPTHEPLSDGLSNYEKTKHPITLDTELHSVCGAHTRLPASSAEGLHVPQPHSFLTFSGHNTTTAVPIPEVQPVVTKPVYGPSKPPRLAQFVDLTTSSSFMAPFALNQKVPAQQRLIDVDTARAPSASCAVSQGATPRALSLGEQSFQTTCSSNTRVPTASVQTNGACPVSMQGQLPESTPLRHNVEQHCTPTSQQHSYGYKQWVRTLSSATKASTMGMTVSTKVDSLYTPSVRSGSMRTCTDIEHYNDAHEQSPLPLFQQYDTYGEEECRALSTAPMDTRDAHPRGPYGRPTTARMSSVLQKLARQLHHHVSVEENGSRATTAEREHCTQGVTAPEETTTLGSMVNATHRPSRHKGVLSCEATFEANADRTSTCRTQDGISRSLHECLAAQAEEPPSSLRSHTASPEMRRGKQFIVSLVGHLERCSEAMSCVPWPVGSYLLVEGDRGVDMGRVAQCRPRTGEDQPASRGTSNGRWGSFPSVLRDATAEEVKEWTETQVREANDTVGSCNEAVASLGLNIRVVGAAYQFDRKKLTFFYQSSERVDFRHLLQALFSQHRCRIWMERMESTSPT